MTITLQKPTTGSRWYYGNFSLGVMVDSHPRFLNVIFALGFVELVVSWEFFGSFDAKTNTPESTED